jgi:HSP20 family protein
MTLFGHYDPVDALLRLQQQLDRVFDRPSGYEIGPSGRGVFPPANVFRDQDGWVVRLEVPGFGPEDLEVESRPNGIVVSGKRDTAFPEKASVHRRERWSGRFSRSIHVPREYDAARAEATCRNGILAIRIPVREEVKPRKIEIANS